MYLFVVCKQRIVQDFSEISYLFLFVSEINFLLFLNFILPLYFRNFPIFFSCIVWDLIECYFSLLFSVDDLNLARPSIYLNYSNIIYVSFHESFVELEVSLLKISIYFGTLAPINIHIDTCTVVNFFIDEIHAQFFLCIGTEKYFITEE